MFGLKNYFSKQISKKEFIDYLRNYLSRKITKENFFNCSKNCKIIVNEKQEFELEKEELEFKSYDFYEIDLSNFEMSIRVLGFEPYELKFRYANLKSINLFLSTLDYVDFEGTDFYKAKFKESQIEHSNLKNCSLVELEIKHTSFIKSNLENIKLNKIEKALIETDTININPKNVIFKFAGICNKLESNFLQVLKDLKNCVVVFLKKGEIETPIGILKFKGDKSFLLIQNIKINESIYQRGICFRTEDYIFEKIMKIDSSKIYKIVLNEINLQTLRPISYEYLNDIFKNIDILLKKIESNEIEFEEISIN